MRVLRLCSVFESCTSDAAVDFDPVGGMQTHTAELTRQLDHLGVEQVVATARPPGSPTEQRTGEHGQVLRFGWRWARPRQMWSAAAWRTVRNDVGAEQNFDIVHAHLGEDLAIVPLAAAAARRHRAPLVVTVHTSLSYTFRASGLRSGLLRTLGGRLERWGERRADALIGLTNRLGRLAQAGGVPAERVYVIPSGVNPARFDPGRAIRERERERERAKACARGTLPDRTPPPTRWDLSAVWYRRRAYVG